VGSIPTGGAAFSSLSPRFFTQARGLQHGVGTWTHRARSRALQARGAARQLAGKLHHDLAGAGAGLQPRNGRGDRLDAHEARAVDGHLQPALRHELQQRVQVRPAFRGGQGWGGGTGSCRGRDTTRCGDGFQPHPAWAFPVRRPRSPPQRRVSQQEEPRHPRALPQEPGGEQCGGKGGAWGEDRRGETRGAGQGGRAGGRGVPAFSP
jgi:hypothetical protein